MKIVPVKTDVYPGVLARVLMKDGRHTDFRVSTYGKLKPDENEPVDSHGIPNSWNAVFKLANNFFTTLTTQQLENVYTFYQTSHAVIQKLSTESIDVLSAIHGVRQYTETLQSAFDLSQRAYDYIRADTVIKYPDLTFAGSRAHDHERLTFRQEEYVYLNAVCLTCKIMAPVWGEYIHIAVKETHLTENSGKEIHCGSLMFKPIYESACFDTICSKLIHFIENMIKNELEKQQKTRTSTKDISFSFALNANTKPKIIDQAFATLCAKRLVLFDPYVNNDQQADSNLMTYVASCVSETLTTSVSNMKTDFLPRRIPTDATGTMADGNVSVVETESVSTGKPADVPIYAQFSGDQAIKFLIQNHKLNSGLLDSMVSYYNNPFVIRNCLPNIFTRTIVGIMAYDYLDGSRTLDHLTLSQWATLLPVCQLILFNKGVDPAIVHLLTCRTEEEPKEIPKYQYQADTFMRSNYDRSVEYAKLLELYPLVVSGKKAVVENIQLILAWVVDYMHYYSTAPALLALYNADAESINQSPVFYSDQLMLNLFKLIIDQQGG